MGRASDDAWTSLGQRAQKTPRPRRGLAYAQSHPLADSGDNRIGVVHDVGAHGVNLPDGEEEINLR